MPFTLTDLETVFERLGADGQIQLIDHLSRRMDCAEGINIKACAEEYADTQVSWTASDSEREAVVESVLYPLVTQTGSATKPIRDHAEAIAERVRRDIEAVQLPRDPFGRAVAA